MFFPGVLSPDAADRLGGISSLLSDPSSVIAETQTGMYPEWEPLPQGILEMVAMSLKLPDPSLPL